MTILAEHSWLIVFYIVSVCLQLAVTLLPRIAVLGWASALVHGIAVVALFLAGAVLEDVLLYLLFSCAVGLGFALFLPDKREKTGEAETDGKEGEETK